MRTDKKQAVSIVSIANKFYSLRQFKNSPEQTQTPTRTA
jgi:hypothetical protein